MSKLPWLLGAGVVGLVLLTKNRTASANTPAPLPVGPLPNPNGGGGAPYYDPEADRRSQQERPIFQGLDVGRNGVERGGVKVVRHGRGGGRGGGWGGGGWNGWNGWGRGWGRGSGWYSGRRGWWNSDWNTPNWWYGYWPQYQNLYTTQYALYPRANSLSAREAYVAWKEAERAGAELAVIADLKRQFEALIFT